MVFLFLFCVIFFSHLNFSFKLFFSNRFNYFLKSWKSGGRYYCVIVSSDGLSLIAGIKEKLFKALTSFSVSRMSNIKHTFACMTVMLTFECLPVCRLPGFYLNILWIEKVSNTDWITIHGFKLVISLQS